MVTKVPVVAFVAVVVTVLTVGVVIVVGVVVVVLSVINTQKRREERFVERLLFFSSSCITIK